MASSDALRTTELAEFLLEHRPLRPEDAPIELQNLRQAISFNGLLSSQATNRQGRSHAWSILLGVRPISVSGFLAIVKMGPSAAYSKIRSDTFRTLATDATFRTAVSDEALSRVLNAFVWKAQKEGLNIFYVQGINVLAAPMLYVSPSESKAFALLFALIKHECPRYATKNLDGVHDGVRLVDRVIKALDPRLYHYLHERKLSASIYAFQHIMTLSASVPPISEVILLWDFLFSYGIHLNILSVAAQVLLLRDQLFKSHTPGNILRKFPNLNAESIIGVTLTLIKAVSDELFDLISRHAYDDTVHDQLDAEDD